MAHEIERKFLVQGDNWRTVAGRGEVYRQGYLSLDHERVVRIRVAGERAVITIKGARREYTALEYEYPVPVADAEEMLEKLCLHPLIEKVRYRVVHGGMLWEVDEFFGDNEGLVIAEVELSSADQSFELPPWVGSEVSDDRRYANASLVQYPYRKWKSSP